MGPPRGGHRDGSGSGVDARSPLVLSSGQPPPDSSAGAAGRSSDAHGTRAPLRQYRQAAGLTQEGLAERAGLSARGIQNLERGASRAPRPDTLDPLAAALGVAAQGRAALLSAAHPRAADLPAGADHATMLRASTLVPLLGRRPELALVAEFLEGTGEQAGAAPLLLLTGEPGIGKTRLLQAAVQQAIAWGWCVLVGGCHRRGGQEPFAPLLDALAGHLQAVRPASLRASLMGCGWLVRLLPELAADLGPVPAAVLAPEQERRLVFAAVARLLANVAGSAGTLLVLDDLQWAGADALDLLATLVHGAPASLRVVGAYRDTEVRAADPLGLLVADLAQARLVRQHTLGPLAPADAAALLDDLLIDVDVGGRGRAEDAVRRAGGTPFFLVSYAQALRQGSMEGVPWDLAQGVRQRVALLPEAARQLLGAAAIVGRHVPRAVLMAMAGQQVDDVLAGLEAACRARLLVEEGEDGYVFAHDVIREVVEAELGAARRGMLHGRVAEALEGTASVVPPEVLAYHFGRAGAQDKAVEYLERAGDHAWGQRAHGAAEGHYRALLECLERGGHAHTALAVREKLSEVLYQTGRYAAACQALEPAAEALRAAGEWERLAEVTARIGWLHSLAGTPHEGLAHIRSMLTQLERGDAIAPAAALYAALGQLALAAGEYALSEVANQRAAELARSCGDTLSHVRAAYNRLCICQLLGRLGAALALGQEVVSLAEDVGHLNTLLAVLRDLAYIHPLRGAFGPSREYIERASLVAGQMQDPGPVAYATAERGWILFLCGERVAARAEIDTAVALSRQAQRSWYSPYPLIFLARLLLAEGDRVGATATLQEGLDLAKQNGDLQALRWASGPMAEIEILEGRPEMAGTRLLPLLDRADLEECDVTMLLPVLAWALLEQGQVDPAVRALEQAIVRARSADMRLVLVDALRVQAMIALRCGRQDNAACSLEEGIALARGMPYPYAEGRLLELYGRLHVRVRELEPA